ncbi:enoyl-CoA hydratase/isomerase family protein [Pseudomonas putida]|nr:enoyl-CoA hydratase/isomerase family protein [Pseudomonas putida]
MEEGLATLTLSRPERKNALNRQVFEQLGDALNQLRSNPQVKALLLTGAGSDFCSGGDINNMGGEVEASARQATMTDANRVLVSLMEFDRPVIAAVDGVAFGAGFSLALAADFVIASERARFCMAFARIGAVADMGASYTLPRIVGYQKAKEIIYCARELSAQDALALGIVLETHPPEAFLDRAREIARSMGNMSPTAFGMSKRLLGRTFESTLQAQLDAEASAQTLAMTSAYFHAATARFLHKEPPMYEWPTTP